MAKTAIASDNTRVKAANPLKNLTSLFIILGCLAVGILVFFFFLGNEGNFDPKTHRSTNIWGLIYEGGYLVPIALTLLFTTVTITIERFITLGRASGKGSMDVFVQRVRTFLESDQVDSAITECDKQAGTVGNVVKAGLVKYKQMAEESRTNPGLRDKEARAGAIQKAIEETTSLELPMLEQNLVIIATIVSIATLVGLIGTVLGMIGAFAALAQSGAPDAVALASGISEALINTAIGISTSTISTVIYNYFTSRIDAMTYRIDEAGFTIVETYNEKYS